MNTGQELQIKGYYQSLYDNNFISTNQCCRYGMEFYLSQLLFMGDLKRVVYSKEDIAFRRRVETLGKGDVQDNNYNYINLDLPYGIYSQEGTYEPDDRGSTQNAGQIVLGQIQPDSGLIVRAAALKVKYNATLFFARRSDVNVAAQLLYWESQPKFPLYFIVQHNLYGWPIDIPVFITLESFDMNTDYAEKDWLTKSKIFPIKCEFVIRSYQTLIESIDSDIKLPLRFQGLYGYNSDNDLVFTEKTSLVWGDCKWSREEFEKLFERKPEIDSQGQIIVFPQDVDPYWRPPYDESKLQNNGELVRKTIIDKDLDAVVADVVEGYFQDERDCTLDVYHQVEDKTTENSAFIEWKIKESEVVNFDSITLYIPGRLNLKLEDVNQTSFNIIDLFPGSEYDCSLVITSKTYTKLTYKLTLQTKGQKVLGKKLSDQLVGKQFQQRTFSGLEVNND
jgi:hypothetical protein